MTLTTGHLERLQRLYDKAPTRAWSPAWVNCENEFIVAAVSHHNMPQNIEAERHAVADAEYAAFACTIAPLMLARIRELEEQVNGD